LKKFEQNFHFRGEGDFMHKKFSELVYDVVARIPHGKVASYGQIAMMLGNPRGARQVGWAMRYCPEGLPWHRVVMADGRIAGGEHSEIRRALLEEENIPFLSDSRVNMKDCGWPGD
jgi:methylated-DNA-protein-cysteine methyltransferase-like protein